MKSLNEIKVVLSFIKGYEVAVFGLYAERRADRHSDIDIAIITREKNRKRCFEIWKDLLGKAPEVYDIKIFELLPLRIKASVLQGNDWMRHGTFSVDWMNTAKEYIKAGNVND